MTPLPAPSPRPPATQKPSPPHRPIQRVAAAALALAMSVAATLPPAASMAQTRTVSTAPDVPGLDAAIAYCTNLSQPAEDARFARKAAELQALEAAVEDRLVALERKRAEFEEWLARRERFIERASDNLVSIYAGMRPDAASEQLAAMDELTAAAIVAKLSARAASAVLNEMNTEKAARIATIMSGLSQDAAGQNAG